MRTLLQVLTGAEAGVAIVMLVGAWLLRTEQHRSNRFAYGITLFILGDIWRAVVGFHRVTSVSVPDSVIRQSIAYHVLIVLGMAAVVLDYRRKLGPPRRRP